MAKKKLLHQWQCPGEGVFLLKPETILLSVLVLLIFVFSYLVFGQNLLAAFLATLLFIFLFLAVKYLIRKVYPIKESYHLTPAGLGIEKRVKNKATKHFIKYSEIKKFKLDKFFHGGRIETKSKRHPLFFNTRKEIEKLEEILSKKLKR